MLDNMVKMDKLCFISKSLKTKSLKTKDDLAIKLSKRVQSVLGK